jgi:hypothetical protein
MDKWIEIFKKQIVWNRAQRIDFLDSKSYNNKACFKAL